MREPDGDDRVTQSHRAAIDVNLVGIQVQLACKRDRLHRERFIQSIKSTSLSDQPVFFRSFLIASTGAISPALVQSPK